MLCVVHWGKPRNLGDRTLVWPVDMLTNGCICVTMHRFQARIVCLNDSVRSEMDVQTTILDASVQFDVRGRVRHRLLKDE